MYQVAEVVVVGLRELRAINRKECLLDSDVDAAKFDDVNKGGNLRILMRRFSLIVVVWIISH